MRITAEWYEAKGPDATVMYHVRQEFEGETREEIDEQIRRRAGNAEVMVVGLQNDLQDYAFYVGKAKEVLAAECPHGFRDSVSRPGPGGLVPFASPDTSVWGRVKRLFSKWFSHCGKMDSGGHNA